MNLVESSTYCTLEKIDELECLHVKHPLFFAEICLQGGQLTQFKHTQLGDFIWLSPDAQYQQGQSLRGGIPICWPWFGVLNKNPDSVVNCVNGEQGSHGFARTQEFTLDSIEESADHVIVELSLNCDTRNDKSNGAWAFNSRLTCRFYLGNELKMDLITHNLDNQPLTFSQALHTYFPVSDLQNTTISGADGFYYVDALDNWQKKQQQGAIQVDQEVDRVYLGKINYALNDGTNNFAISSNSASSVVWNPWIDKSKTLSQFDDLAYQSMVCIENGNILNDVVTLSAGESHTLSMEIKKLN